MNPYSELLKISLSEIDEFTLSEKGSEWDLGWYSQLKELVANAAQESSQDRAEELMDMVSWCIVDSGPIGCGFAPSINQAQEVLIKVRRKREIDRHEKPN
jgi:hypothetical protein